MKFIIPLFMCKFLVSMYYFNMGITGNSHITIRGNQARIHIILLILCFAYMFYRKLQKSYFNTYKIFLLGFVFLTLMFLGCHFYKWWNGWMAIPLTIIWYPFHYRIISNLPLRTIMKNNSNSQENGDIENETN